MSKNFENLMNAPVSTGYFEFKSERNWTQPDTSKFSELFTIDVKNLSMMYNCIPFNQYIEVEDEYFTEDQLTFINSTTEQAKKVYEKDLQRKKSVPLVNIEKSIGNDSIEEDLDFLLSLKEPFQQNISRNITATSTQVGTNELKVKSHIKESNSIDLEQWLDSVLDD